MTLIRIHALLAPAAAAFLFSLSPAAQAIVDCSIPSQRDATCVGSISSIGALTTSNSTLNPNLRGSNATAIAGVTIPTPQALNECVTVPLTTWAYDPLSFGTPLPSFVTLTGAGYLGSAGAGSPLDTCASSTDGSCATWVPSAYPYLFTGGNNFVSCDGPNVMGSVSCPVRGAQAYATTNANAGWNFAANMIACKKGTAAAGSMVAGAPFSWWSNCSTSAQCSFYMVYPPADTGSGTGGI